MNSEIFSGIKVLVALAQADALIHDDERIAIENALDGAALPGGQSVTSLLAAEIDLPAELARITSADARQRTYDAACALVYVDGEVSPDEQRMLATVSEAFGITESEAPKEVFAKFKSTTPPSTISEIDDPAERKRIVTEEIAGAASFSAVLATASLPIAAESCLFTNNVRLARNIGLVYGHDADDLFWRTFANNVVGAAAPWFAIASLLKLIPGSGNGSAAYASTFALGTVTRLYFERAEDVSTAALRAAFADAKKEGQKQLGGARGEIAARHEQLQAPKRALDAALAAGTLTDTDYANKLIALA
jgi:uncharacterized protein (DUF697 family)